MKVQSCLGIFSLVYIALLIGCVTPPEYPIEPYIEFLSLSKDTMPRGSFTDSVLVTLSFTDGDGDIGSKNLENNLFFTDSRDTNQLPGQIPLVPELGASNGINGEISFIIDNSCCVFPNPLYIGCEDELPSYPYDKIIYTVYIVDRAGHHSNIVEIPPIYIRCFE